MNHSDPTNLELAKTDPRLDALLDEALAPEPTPAGLNDRIVAATADRLPSARSDSSPVVGRIGGGFPWRSVAAVLLLGGVVGGMFLANRDDDPTDQNDPRDLVLTDTTEQVHLGLDQLADAELQADSIDDEIALLSMQLSATQSPSVWEQDAIESLDAAIAFEEFDQLQNEIDLYF